VGLADINHNEVTESYIYLSILVSILGSLLSVRLLSLKAYCMAFKYKKFYNHHKFTIGNKVANAIALQNFTKNVNYHNFQVVH
jgi:hypothetical protein